MIYANGRDERSAIFAMHGFPTAAETMIRTRVQKREQTKLTDDAFGRADSTNERVLAKGASSEWKIVGGSVLVERIDVREGSNTDVEQPEPDAAEVSMQRLDTSHTWVAFNIGVDRGGMCSFCFRKLARRTDVRLLVFLVR